MYKREALIQTPEYLFETIQNELYRQVAGYLKSENITQSQLAEKLGVSKGYISQIMNGNFNYTLKKLIELSLAIGKAPVLEFKEMKEYIKEDNIRRFNMQYTSLCTINDQKSTRSFKIGNEAKTTVLKIGTYTPANKKIA